MRNRFVLIVFLLSFVFVATAVHAGEPETYKPTWESLAKHPTPEWFKDAKFGIFIHWGVYAVPGWAPEDRYAEWYPHRMYMKGTPTFKYHREHYGDQGEFGYKDFIPMFKAEKWDPDRWARLFRKAGARYVVPVAEHHDGFAMWDSDLTEWDAMDKGPHRDLIGELAEAVRAEGMKFSASSHRARHWWYYPYDEDFDTADPRYSGLYCKPHGNTRRAWPNPKVDPPDEEFLDDWKARWEEIRDKYKPDIMWFDGMWGLDPVFLEYDKEMMADYYNKAREWGKEVGINNKGGKFRRKGLIPTEVGDWIEGDYMKQEKISEVYWQNPRGIGHSYGYNRNEEPEDYNTTNDLVDELVDIVSKNGNMLLNVGPRADGVIPEVQRDRLRGIGKWLEVNGEAIYRTRHWRTFGGGSIRYTQKGEKTLYAIALEWPGKRVVLADLKGTKPASVRMLGVPGELSWSMTEDGVEVETPDKKPCKHAWALKIALSE